MRRGDRRVGRCIGDVLPRKVETVSAEDADNSLLWSTSVFTYCKETHIIRIRSQEYNAFEVILYKPTVKIST